MVDERDHDGVEEIVGRQGDDGAAELEVEGDSVEVPDRAQTRLDQFVGGGPGLGCSVVLPVLPRTMCGRRFLIEEGRERRGWQRGHLPDGATGAGGLREETQALDVGVGVESSSAR